VHQWADGEEFDNYSTAAAAATVAEAASIHQRQDGRRHPSRHGHSIIPRDAPRTHARTPASSLAQRKDAAAWIHQITAAAADPPARLGGEKFTVGNKRRHSGGGTMP